MALDEDFFELEYVTGGIQLPAWGTWPLETFANVSVLNIGPTAAVTRAFGLRGLGANGILPAEQVFDSDTDIDSQEGPFTGEIQPGEAWFYTWTLLGGGDLNFPPLYMYWFRILATSPNLIPSIEIVSQNSPTPQNDPENSVPVLDSFSVVARYAFGDFSMVHRQTSIVVRPEVNE